MQPAYRWKSTWSCLYTLPSISLKASRTERRGWPGIEKKYYPIFRSTFFLIFPNSHTILIYAKALLESFFPVVQFHLHVINWKLFSPFLRKLLSWFTSPPPFPTCLHFVEQNINKQENWRKINASQNYRNLSVAKDATYLF